MILPPPFDVQRGKNVGEDPMSRITQELIACNFQRCSRACPTMETTGKPPPKSGVFKDEDMHPRRPLRDSTARPDSQQILDHINVYQRIPTSSLSFST